MKHKYRVALHDIDRGLRVAVMVVPGIRFRRHVRPAHPQLLGTDGLARDRCEALHTTRLGSFICHFVGSDMTQCRVPMIVAHSHDSARNPEVSTNPLRMLAAVWNPRS